MGDNREPPQLEANAKDLASQVECNQRKRIDTAGKYAQTFKAAARIPNPRVAGSSPAGPTMIYRGFYTIGGLFERPFSHGVCPNCG